MTTVPGPAGNPDRPDEIDPLACPCGRNCEYNLDQDCCGADCDCGHPNLRGGKPKDYLEAGERVSAHRLDRIGSVVVGTLMPYDDSEGERVRDDGGTVWWVDAESVRPCPDPRRLPDLLAEVDPVCPHGIDQHLNECSTCEAPAPAWINIVFIRCASGVLELVGVQDGNGSPINVGEWVDHYTGDPEYTVLRITTSGVPAEPSAEMVERVAREIYDADDYEDGYVHDSRCFCGCRLNTPDKPHLDNCYPHYEAMARAAIAALTEGVDRG